MVEKIMVVDDEPETVEFIKILLSKQGYQVIVARNGMEALALARQELPDVIVLDIMMPGLDGFEVARSLKRNSDTSTIPILMFTARSAVDDKMKGYEAGVDIFLTKPAHPLDFNANIKALLIQKKARNVALSEHGYVVGVIAAKGGLGVSTVSLNLAVSYAKSFGAKTIATEMRPGQGIWADELNIDTNLGLSQLLCLEPAEIDKETVENQLVQTKHGVRLMLASNRLSNQELVNRPVQFESIVTALEQISSLVVLDIGTPFHPAISAIISLCSEVIIVTEPQAMSVKQTLRLLETLREAGIRSSRPLTVVMLNHTRSDITLSMSQVENILQCPVALGFPPAMELAAHSAQIGVPMCVAQPENLIAQQYIKLAQIVKKHRETGPD